MKQIKDDKGSKLSSDSLVKRAILFITAYLEEACLLCTSHGGSVTMISCKTVMFFINLTHAYFRIDLELEKVGVDFRFSKTQ